MLWKAGLAFLLLALSCPPLWAKQRVKPLLSKLRKAEGERQIPIVQAIGRTGKKEAVEPLLALLDVRKNPPRLTSALILALGDLKDERAADELIGAWDYLNSLKLQMQGDFPAHLQIMRGTVIEALGKVGGPRAVPILHDALQDKDQFVVGKAAIGVGALKDASSIEALVQLAGRGGNLGQSAVEALADIGDPRGLSTLQRLLRSEDPATRAQAAYGLAKLKSRDDDGELELTNMTANERLDNRDRLLAAHYLARLGSRAGLDYLTARLTSGPASSRALAAQALGRAKHAKAVPPLAEAALRSKDPSLRLVIAQSLGQIGGTRAVYTLRRMEDDDNKSVRAAARQALSDMGEDL